MHSAGAAGACNNLAALAHLVHALRPCLSGSTAWSRHGQGTGIYAFWALYTCIAWFSAYILRHVSAITQLCMVMRYRTFDSSALQNHLANASLAVHSFGPVHCTAKSEQVFWWGSLCVG